MLVSSFSLSLPLSLTHTHTQIPLVFHFYFQSQFLPKHIFKKGALVKIGKCILIHLKWNGSVNANIAQTNFKNRTFFIWQFKSFFENKKNLNFTIFTKIFTLLSILNVLKHIDFVSLCWRPIQGVGTYLPYLRLKYIDCLQCRASL